MHEIDSLTRVEKFILFSLLALCSIFVLGVGLLLPAFYVIIFFNGMFLFIVVFYLVLFLNKKDYGKAKPPKEYPFVTLVVPCFNSMNTIKGCIDSVKKIKWPGKLEIIVIDDCSTDGSREYLETVKGIKLVKLKTNSGKAVAVNTAFSNAKSEYVVCIDSDSYPESDVLLKTMGYFEEKDVAAVTCLVLPDKNKTIVQKIQHYEYIISFGLGNALFSSIGSSYVVPGPYSAFRRSVFSTVGYFQQGNLAEDMEFGLRLKRHGLKIMTCFEAVVYTDIPHSVRNLIKQRDRWYRGGTFNFVKYRELLFNKTNPDFGFFVMPFIFFSNVLTIILLFRTMFFLVNDIYSWLVVTLSYLALGGSLFFAINEIILPPSVFFFTTSYVLVCIYFALAFFSAKQYPPLKDLPVVAMLILIYPFFISFIYTRAYFREMFGVRAKWLRVST